MSARNRTWGIAVLLVLAAAAVAIVALAGEVRPDGRYHDFADEARRLGIPNGANVLSNLPFLVIGGWGTWRLWRRGDGGRTGWQHAAAITFAIGVALVAVGSSWYHLEPNDVRLDWDRLPITLAFTSLFALVIGERVDDRLGRWLSIPLIVAGAISALTWRQLGDLRFYGIVQYGSALGIVGLATFCRSPDRPSGPIWLAGGLYLGAKVFECAAVDAAVLACSGGWLSGHSLKHLLAAGATLALMRLLTRPPAAPFTARR